MKTKTNKRERNRRIIVSVCVVHVNLKSIYFSPFKLNLDFVSATYDGLKFLFNVKLKCSQNVRIAFAFSLLPLFYMIRLWNKIADRLTRFVRYRLIISIQIQHFFLDSKQPDELLLGLFNRTIVLDSLCIFIVQEFILNPFIKKKFHWHFSAFLKFKKKKEKIIKQNLSFSIYTNNTYKQILFDCWSFENFQWPKIIIPIW